ncbi:MAG: biopolymer transporter ExbD [Dysgonomonas sp.]|nr:biopolymer transporter ExbD [Dysgonomonas sp.]
MAEMNIDSGGGRRRRKGSPSRVNLRVDFTPMVDMNMLLITFFMFCTTLAAPQVMDIVMPTRDTPPDRRGEIGDSQATTLILGKDNKVYYYFGKPDYENPQALMETDFSNNGLRSVLLNKNQYTISRIQELKKKRQCKEISEEQMKEEISNIKKEKGGQVVVIKPTDESSYKDLVNTLDEMQICGIGRYAVVDIEEGDQYLLDNFINTATLAEAK